jgi:UDP-N-acetyl-D-mannosaminuronic acid dehydrogenase
MKKVSIIGLGYIGLPTAVIAAEAGYDVWGYDIDTKKIATIASGSSPIEEPFLASRLNAVISEKKFSVGSTLQRADYFIVAVPTPFKKGKKADLQYVEAAFETIVSVIVPGNVVIIESTIPVGATRLCASVLEKKTGYRLEHDIFVAHCPERVLPGNVFHELEHNNRLIGGCGPRSGRRAREFYAAFVKGELRICSDMTAEMVKLVENSFRDVNIAFANQVAAMARSVGINPFEVIEFANKHPRVNILQPGCGVGGHCIAVDPWFLVETFPDQSRLLKTARRINDRRVHELIGDVVEQATLFKKEHKRKQTVLLLGLTFKPNIDDTRESPALSIAQNLSKKASLLNLVVCEPHLSLTQIKRYRLQACTLSEGILKADMIVALVKHNHFKELDISLLEGKKIIDACGLLHELTSNLRPSLFHAARAVHDDEKQASLRSIQRNG